MDGPEGEFESIRHIGVGNANGVCARRSVKSRPSRIASSRDGTTPSTMSRRSPRMWPDGRDARWARWSVLMIMWRMHTMRESMKVAKTGDLQLTLSLLYGISTSGVRNPDIRIVSTIDSIVAESVRVN